MCAKKCKLPGKFSDCKELSVCRFETETTAKVYAKSSREKNNSKSQDSPTPTLLYGETLTRSLG